MNCIICDCNNYRGIAIKISFIFPLIKKRPSYTRRETQWFASVDILRYYRFFYNENVIFLEIILLTDAKCFKRRTLASRSLFTTHDRSIMNNLFPIHAHEDRTLVAL